MIEVQCHHIQLCSWGTTMPPPCGIVYVDHDGQGTALFSYIV